MFAAPADLAQRLKQAIKAAKLSPGLLVEYSVYYPQHEDEVLKAFKELEELTDTPDVEAFVKRVLKGKAPAWSSDHRYRCQSVALSNALRHSRQLRGCLGVAQHYQQWWKGSTCLG